MKIKYGNGRTQYGPGVLIELDGNEVATAIDAYLVAHGVYVSGPRTIKVNGDLCEEGNIYVDPSGFVIADGEKLSGRGPTSMNRRSFLSTLGLAALTLPAKAKPNPKSTVPQDKLPWVKRSEILGRVDRWTADHWDPESVPYRCANGDVIGFGRLKTVYIDLQGYAMVHYLWWRTYGYQGQCRVAVRNLRLGDCRTGSKPFEWEELNLTSPKRPIS